MLTRPTNLFEKILLPIAFAVAVFGFYMIINTQGTDSWLKLIALFIWLMLIFLMVVAAANEDMKEELAIIIRDQSDELKSLKDLNVQLVEETKLLRTAFIKEPKKK